MTKQILKRQLTTLIVSLILISSFFIVVVSANDTINTTTTTTENITISNSSSTLQKTTVPTKPLKPTGISITSKDYDTIIVKWKEVSNADGYEVYRFVNGKSVFYKDIKNGNTTSFYNYGKLPATTYYYKLRTYNFVNGKKVYSYFTDLIQHTIPSIKPDKPTSIDAVATSYTSINLSWDKIKNADGYEVYRFVNGKSVFYKDFDEDTTSFNNLGKKRGVTYYYKIRSYIKFDGKKYYSYFSPLISCTVPKNINDTYPMTDRLGYKSLSSSEKTIYKQIVNCLLNKQSSVVTNATSGNDIDPIRYAIMADYPELFYWTGLCKYEWELKNSTYYIKYIPTYDYSISTINSMEKKLDALVNSFVDDFYSTYNFNVSEYQRAKSVYEYVIENTTYNLNAVNAQTAYGSLIDGESVCAGYSRGVQLLLHALDVENLYTRGYILGGEYHAWNLAKLDGNYYYMDATWGDKNFGLANVSDVTYSYFCITTEQLKRTRTIDTNIPVPTCTSTKYNYYAYNNFYCNSYSYNNFYNIIKPQINYSTYQQNYVIQFSSLDEMYTAVNKLYYSFEFWSMLENLGLDYYDYSAWNYSYDKDLYILTIYRR